VGHFLRSQFQNPAGGEKDSTTGVPRLSLLCRLTRDMGMPSTSIVEIFG